MRNALLEPGMRQEDLDRLIQRRLETLKQIKASPQSVAARVSDPVLYGAGHHKGRVTTKRSYKSITVADCTQYHQEYLKPGGARLFVVGDMTKSELKKRTAAPLASWQGKVPRIAKANKPASFDGAIFFVDIPGSAQSAVRLMHFGPQRKARDYLVTELMSAVLGGGFASRINMNLREDKGYSYGARAGFHYSRDDGVFVMSSAVRSDSTYQTIVEMLNEITALKSGARAVTADELTREKNSAILGLPGKFATSRQALSMYRALVYFGLPLNYYNKYVAQVGRVSAKQVTRSAKQRLKLDDAKIVVVGDGSAPMIQRIDGEDKPLMKDGKQVTLLEGLRELAASGRVGKGELVVLDADSKILSKPAAETPAAPATGAD
jgi:zinc protease